MSLGILPNVSTSEGNSSTSEDAYASPRAAPDNHPQHDTLYICV
jgi:hypothetical protein